MTKIYSGKGGFLSAYSASGVESVVIGKAW